MIRGLIVLVILFAVGAVIVSLLRRSGRRSEDAPPPPPREVPAPPPPALPAPEMPEGSHLSVEAVLHKLNEVAFSRSLTTSVAGHEEIVAGGHEGVRDRSQRAALRTAPAGAAPAARTGRERFGYLRAASWRS